MLKFHLMIETIAEKALGRLLPQVEAQANHCFLQKIGCCGYCEDGCCTHTFYRELCDGIPTGYTECRDVLCPC